MTEIIGPDGKAYYTEDHFSADAKVIKKPKISLDTLTDRVYLVGWGVAILIWLWLLADIAVWLILLFLWSTGVNYWMMKHRK